MHRFITILLWFSIKYIRLPGVETWQNVYLCADFWRCPAFFLFHILPCSLMHHSTSYGVRKPASPWYSSDPFCQCKQPDCSFTCLSLPLICFYPFLLATSILVWLRLPLSLQPVTHNCTPHQKKREKKPSLSYSLNHLSLTFSYYHSLLSSFQYCSHEIASQEEFKKSLTYLFVKFSL